MAQSLTDHGPCARSASRALSGGEPAGRRSGRICSVQPPGFHGARRGSGTRGKTTYRRAPQCAPARLSLRSRQDGLGWHGRRRSEPPRHLPPGSSGAARATPTGVSLALSGTPQSLEQFADLPPVVRLATPEGQRRPQRLTYLLQQFLQRPTRPGGGIVDVPAFSRSRASWRCPSFHTASSSAPRRGSRT